MTSTNDGKDVKSYQISSLKAKTYYIELYKNLDSRLSTESELDARTSHLCEAWRRVHCLCLHSAPSTHPHLISWLQRHTAQTLLQSEWQKNVDKQKALEDAIDFFIGECQKGAPNRASPHWEVQLLQRAQWFKKVIPDPWGNSVLKALLGLPDPSLASSTGGEGPTDREILEWLKEERGVFFVTRLRQLGTSNCTELTKVALKLASSVMDRIRACMGPTSDGEQKADEYRDKEEQKISLFMETLTKEAGFTIDIVELITDIEFVLLHKDQAKCIDLAKKTPLNIGYQLVERLNSRLELSPREKRLWKNSKKVATLIAQVMVARCMVVPVCANSARSTLYGCSRSLVKLLPEDRLPATMAALAAPAVTSRHLHTLAHAVHSQCKNERKPFVCELYIRAITTGMNELERLKLNKEKESEARAAEQTLSSWFTQLGSLLGESARLAYECALTAFSVHPSRAMYDRIADAPTLQPHSGQATHKDVQVPALETNTEFGSWATDSRSQTNFVKTSETLNLKKTQKNSNVLSTAILNEGETLGLSPELCQDLIVLLSGPRVKTLSWDMDKEILIENCRSYMERTHGGTKALTTELKYLNLNPDSFNHLPEEEDEDEGDIYYGIEKGYEHLVELQDPEEIWEDALTDFERTESCYSTDEEPIATVPRRKKKTRRLSATTDDDEKDPLSTVVTKLKPRSRSDEGSKEISEHRSKGRSKERKKKERHKKERSASRGKKKEIETLTSLIETDPLMLEAELLQPKPKKERKTREKKEKKDKGEPKKQKIPKKKFPVSSALSRLIGKKVIRVNANDQQKISKTITDTDFNNQLFISDIDYDSQGKSSVASMHTEGNESDVLFDGLYSMDEIKSPEKSSTVYPETIKILNHNNSNKEMLEKPTKVPTSTKIMNSHNLLSGSIINKQARPSTIPMFTKNKSIPSEKNEKDDVKLNIKRLLEFRRQKSATDLCCNRNSIAKPDPYLHNSVLNKILPQKTGSPDTVETGLRMQSGCPKAISVPNIPKVIINKQQSKQINVLKNEVDSYLININNNPKLETKQTHSRIGKSELQLNNTQSNLKSNRPLNNTEQVMFNVPRHNLPVKVIDNVTSNPVLQSVLKTSPNDSKPNISSTEPNFQSFLKDLQRSINAGVCKTGVRSSGNVPEKETPSASFIKYTAKPIKPQKKVENALNTFARLNYMHKNKQGDTLIKQNNDQVMQNRLHCRPVEAKKVVNILSDTIISPGDTSVIKTHNNSALNRKIRPSNDDSYSNTVSNVDQCMIKKPVALDEKLAKISTPVQCTNYTSLKSTMLTDTDQNQLLLLLRQQSKLNVTRPQIRENVINKVSSFPITQTSVGADNKSYALSLQNNLTRSFCDADNQIKACQGLQGSLIQSTQNISVPIEHPRSSSITKIPETSKPIIQQKKVAGNTKRIRHPKGEIKINNEPQDWQSVMDALSAQKTPSRGLSALDMVLQNDAHQKQLTKPNSLVPDQRVTNMNSVCDLKTNATVITNASRKERNILNCKMLPSTPLSGTNNVTSLKNDCSLTINKAPYVVNKLPVQTDGGVSRKGEQTFITKRVDKNHVPQISFGALKREISCGTSQATTQKPTVALKKESNLDAIRSRTDPMLSDALPTFSDYDLLEELMDDDLRQEIGELLSDEERFSSSNTVLKGNKVKSDIIKQIPTDVAYTGDISRHSNVRQIVCKSNVLNWRPDTKILKHTVTPESTCLESTNRIKNSNPAQATTIIQNTMKKQPVIQKIPTTNVGNNIHSPVIVTRNSQTNQGHHIVSKSVTNNKLELSDSSELSATNQITTQIEQQSTDTCNKPVLANCMRPTIKAVQTTVYRTVTQQPLQNVVLIGPKIVYDPCLQVNGNSTEFNSSSFVAVPNIPLYSSQLAGPVINPLMIASHVTVSNTETVGPIIDTACNKVACDSVQLQDIKTNVSQRSESEEKSSLVEFGPLRYSMDSNQVEKITMPSRPSEQCTTKDNIVKDILMTDVKPKPCYINSSLEKKFPAVQDTQIDYINLKKFYVSEHDNREILEVPEVTNSKTKGITKNEIETEVLKGQEKTEKRDFHSEISGVSDYVIKTDILMTPKIIQPKTSGVGKDEFKNGIDKAREDNNSKTSDGNVEKIEKEILNIGKNVNSKVSHVVEDKIETDIYIAEERMRMKRNAILNRQVYIGSTSTPIPLSYAPVIKVSPENTEKKLASKLNVHTGQINKTQEIALGFEAITSISQVTDAAQNVIVKKTDLPKMEEKKMCTADIILEDPHKEKKESDTIEIGRSINKLAENTSVLKISPKSEMCDQNENTNSTQCQPSDGSKDKNKRVTRTLRSSKSIQNKIQLQNAQHDDRLDIHDVINESMRANVSKDNEKIEVESNRCTLRSSNRSVNELGVHLKSLKSEKKITINTPLTRKDLSVQENASAQLTDSAKENNKVKESESNAHEQGPLHQLPVANSPFLSKRMSKKPVKKIFKTKLKLNLKNIENHDNVNKGVEIRNMTKPKVHKIRIKNDTSIQQQKNNSNIGKMTENDLQDLDFEEQLLGSIIVKDNFVTKPNEKQEGNNTDHNKSKESITKNIDDSNCTNLNSVIKKVNSMQSIDTPYLQKEVFNNKFSACDKLESTNENFESNQTKKSDTNEITPDKKLCSKNSSNHHDIDSENNETNNVNYEGISNEDVLTVVKNNETLEVKKPNDLKSENQIMFAENCVSLPSKIQKLKEKYDSTYEEKKIIDNLRDKITIKDLPRKENDDPLKRCITIKLSNGNSYKATVSGKLDINIDTLFEDPSIRSILLNNVPSNARCVLHVQRVGTTEGDQIKTTLVYPDKKNLDIINLISDDEDENENPQTIKTEFGVFNVKGIDNSVLKKHQNKFLQRCSVMIERSKVPLHVTLTTDVEKTVDVEDSLTGNVCSKLNYQDLDLSHIGKPSQSETMDIIEIDESSNDSVLIVNAPFEVQQLITPESINNNLKELKETLLQDLCVDIDNNKFNQKSSFTQLLTRNEETFTDACSKLKDTICKELNISEAASSVKLIDKTTNIFETRESKCKRSSPLKKKYTSPKRCRLNIERCDELIKQHQIQNITKKCFVSLQRCDNLLPMYTQKKASKLEMNSKTISIIENAIPQSTLKRSDSLSILNDFDVVDQCYSLKTCKNYADFEACQSDWFMTKPNNYYLNKHIHINDTNIALLDDDISTDCESDVDTSLSNIFVGENERSQVSDYQTHAEIPSLLNLTLKILKNYTVLDSLNYKDNRTLKISTETLKRKLSQSECCSSDIKILKLDSETQSSHSTQSDLSDKDIHLNVGLKNVVKSRMDDNLILEKRGDEIVSEQFGLQVQVPDLKVFAQIVYELKDETPFDGSNSEILSKHRNSPEKKEEFNVYTSKQKIVKSEDLFRQLDCENVVHPDLEKDATKISVSIFKDRDRKREKSLEIKNDFLYEQQYKEVESKHLQISGEADFKIQDIKNTTKDLNNAALRKAEGCQVQTEILSKVLRLDEIATKIVINLIYGNLTVKSKKFLEQFQCGIVTEFSVNSSKQFDTKEMTKTRQQDREMINGKEVCCAKRTKNIVVDQVSKECKLYMQQEIQGKMLAKTSHLHEDIGVIKKVIPSQIKNQTEKSSNSLQNCIHNETFKQPMFNEKAEKCFDNKILLSDKTINPTLIPLKNTTDSKNILKDKVSEDKAVNNKIFCSMDENKDMTLGSSSDNDNLEDNIDTREIFVDSLIDFQVANDHNKIRSSTVIHLINENNGMSHPIQEICDEPKCDFECFSTQARIGCEQYSSEPSYNTPKVLQSDIFNQSESHLKEKKENISSRLEVPSGTSKSKLNSSKYIITDTNVMNFNSTVYVSSNTQNNNGTESENKCKLQGEDIKYVTELNTNIITVKQADVVNSDSINGNRDNSSVISLVSNTECIKFNKLKYANTSTDQVNSILPPKINYENDDTLVDERYEPEHDTDNTSVTVTCREIEEELNVENNTNVHNQELQNKYYKGQETDKIEIDAVNENHVLLCKLLHFGGATNEEINASEIVAEGMKRPKKSVHSNGIMQGNSLVNEEHSSLQNMYDNNCDDIMCTNSLKRDINNDIVKDIDHSKIGTTEIPQNITVLYEGSSVILKGSIIEDAIVGTCYLFPIHHTDILNSVMHNSDQIEKNVDQTSYITHEDSILPELCNELLEDKELVVSKPKLTYSKLPRMLKRGSKRKFETADSIIVPKKYRKGKNIDYPKITVTAMCECAYSKEFKKLSNYFSSIKFSYTKDYHLLHLQDVHAMLEDWPIKELHVPAVITSDTDCSLFVEKVQNKLSDPSTQTLAEEISAVYDDDSSCLDEINETNFSMGFGEGSGRVNLNFKNRRERIKFMAATLSDVKQYQPIILPSSEYYKQETLTSTQDQLLKLDKFYSNIKLRDKIRSYFKETTAMLNSSYSKNDVKCSKDKPYSNNLCGDINKLLIDCNSPEFFEPAITETVVQIVQIGQLPVSAAAQNPVTCDPRVTQVTDASLPQCSMENDSPDDMQANIKTEYTELTTADISLPIMPDYEHQHQTLISASQVSNLPNGNDNITIETEVKIEVLDEVPESMDDNSCYDNKDFPKFPSDQITNNDKYQLNESDMNVQVKTEPDLKIVLEPTDTNQDEDQVTESYKSPPQNGLLEKPDQLAHAMNAAGITPSPEPTSEESAIDLSNTVSRSICEENEGSNFQRSTITPLTLQQALNKIIPQHLNQINETEANSQTSVASQLLHIVHGKKTSLNQISLADNSQQSAGNTHSTPVFHIVQSKSSPSTSVANSLPPQNPNSYNSLSLLDTGLSQGGNQLLHIVNANAQKSNNTPVLKRVNLVTNVTNAQGSCEQKMVQILCKPSDAKGIQLNTHQRSMVLRLHPIETPTSTISKSEIQDTVITNTDSIAKDPVVSTPQVELKSRSVYEENYAKFIQDCNKQAAIEPSVTLPKFNQAFFGKPVFQENNQKTNEVDVTIPSVDTSVESNCTSNGHAYENTQQINSPLLLRKTSQTSQSQQNLAQHVKQGITPMNIQTMHGGVIYTRQIPVNIGSGQTINLITVPSTERVDDPVQKQKTDVKFAGRGEMEQSFIKIVPQAPVTANTEISTEETNTAGVSNENAQNSQPPPMLTQMRIKLPMLSKNTPMVPGARVVRPSFFQIQRNVIGGTNQPVYQQLVLTAAPTLGHSSIRLPQMQTSQEIKDSSENKTSPESEMSSSTLHEQLQEFDKIMEQVKERSTGQPAYDTNSPPADTTENASNSTPSETTQQILYSIGNNQQLNVAYINRKSSSATTTASTSFARSPDSSSTTESPTSSTHAPTSHMPRASTSETSNDSSPSQNNKISKPSSKSKSRPKTHHPQFKFNHVPPKPSNQKPIEDEQTTQRILYILAEYKEQVENSPDKDKPAPRRRTNLQAGGVIAPGGSKNKKKRRNGRDSSPIDDNCRTMGSEDSSCGTSQGDCNETCNESNSPQGSPRKVAKKLSFDQDPPVTPRPQPPRNVLVTDGPTIAVTRAAPGKPATAVLMPANYILPVSMVKSGQQIAIVTNRGPKILTVGGTDGGATNALLLQRLIGPAGLKPMLARPGIRHVRLPTAALQNLQAFNINAFPNAAQPDAPPETPVPACSPPQLIETKTPQSPWTAPDQEEVKPERESSPEEPEQEQEPWSVPQDYSYEETVRTEMDRTVLVVQRRDGVNNRHRFLSAATLRQKFALMEDELRLQKSLSEECEDLGVDSPSASDLFPEAELLFSSSPAHEASQPSHTPQPAILGQSSISPPDVDDQAATDHLIAPVDSQVPDKSPTDDIDLGLEDVGIVTVSEDGMRATISLDHEEFVRSHPNTTFHREPTDDGEVQPITIDDLKARHLTSTIFHAGRAPATVLVSTPQTTVISQATPDGSGVDNVRCPPIDNLMPSAPPKDESLDRFDSLLNDSRELHLSNSASAIIHSTGNATQVIRRVCYDDRRDEPRYLDDHDGLMERNTNMTDDRETLNSSGDVDDDRSSPERNAEMFWEMHSRARRLDFSSDSDKCCKSPYDENNSTDSSGIGTHMRLDSVIKDARVDRTGTESMSHDDGNLPPLRTYGAKRSHHEGHSGRRDDRFPDSGEGKRRASNRGVVKRGCHCCNGSSAPAKPKKPRLRKPHMDN